MKENTLLVKEDMEKFFLTSFKIKFKLIYNKGI